MAIYQEQLLVLFRNRLCFVGCVGLRWCIEFISRWLGVGLMVIMMLLLLMILGIERCLTGWGVELEWVDSWNPTVLRALSYSMHGRLADCIVGLYVDCGSGCVDDGVGVHSQSVGTYTADLMCSTFAEQQGTT